MGVEESGRYCRQGWSAEFRRIVSEPGDDGAGAGTVPGVFRGGGGETIRLDAGLGQAHAAATDGEGGDLPPQHHRKLTDDGLGQGRDGG